jgi:nickel-dependent lactate racemase
VPNGLILPVVVRQLLQAGLAAQRIRILVATGLHRPNEGEELRELIGDDWVLRNIEVVNHFARNDADHVEVGTTSNGTQVKLDRRFVQADIRIATGLVEPHFMAGYSGGRKVIAPGIAHRDTITRFHSARFMEHPKAANSVLDGNPLHQDQLEIVSMLGGAQAVNVVLDDERRVSFINYGEIVQSHLEAVAYVRQYAEVAVPRRFPTVITSAAGYPLDQTYYQTVKGMVGPMDILEPGGNLLVASACSEGMGSAEYVAAQERLIRRGSDGFLQDLLAKSHADIDEWQTEMQLKPMRVGQVHLYTDGLSAEQRALTGVTVVPSLARAVADLLARARDKSVAVIPEGPYVVPVYTPGT